jgi:hypothetical protein
MQPAQHLQHSTREKATQLLISSRYACEDALRAEVMGRHQLLVGDARTTWVQHRMNRVCSLSGSCLLRVRCTPAC